MLNDEMMEALKNIQPEEKEIGLLGSLSLNYCDCIGGCTDMCYGCSEDSSTQW